MANIWFNKITSPKIKAGDYSLITEALAFFENEIDEAKKDFVVKGLILRQASEIPGLMTHRYNQLQELEAMLQFLNIRLTVARTSAYKRYLEAYNRDLSSRDASTYADGDPTVYTISDLINQVSLIRNQMLGVTKGIEAKHWQINNMVKLKAAGFEDFEVND